MTFSVTTLTVGRSTVRRALSSSASTASGADTGRSSRNEGVRRSSWARSGGFDGTVHHPTRLHHLLTMTGTVSQSTSTASPSPALRGEVRIHLQGSNKDLGSPPSVVVASPPLGLSLTAGGSSTSSRASILEASRTIARYEVRRGTLLIEVDELVTGESRRGRRRTPDFVDGEHCTAATSSRESTPR